MVPARGVHKAINYRVYPDKILARPGSKRWSDVVFPYLPGRTGYSFTKSGTTVTKTVGTNFSAADVGNYIVHDDGTHERIEQYLTVNSVRVSTSTAHAASTAGWVRGPKNAWLFHKKTKLVVLFIDTRIYYSDVTLASWTRIYQSGSGPEPESAISRMRSYDDYVILFNGAGMFKIDLIRFDFWMMNSACPTVRITDVAQSPTMPYCRNYLYKMGRITGTGQTRDRYTADCEIQQETGTVVVDASGKDYGAVFTERPVGEGKTYFGRLTGAALVSPNDSSATWAAISDGRFVISINGESNEIICDFSACTSMSQVAEQIQLGMRDFFPKATCVFSVDHFVIESPEEGGSVSATSDATVVAPAVNVSGMMMTAAADGGLVSSERYTEPCIIGELEIPIDPTTGKYDSHNDFYVISSTLDVGENGADPASKEINNNQRYVWQYDLPVAKALTAAVTNTYGTVEIIVTAGTLQDCDVGSTLRFQDGTEITIGPFNGTNYSTTYSGTVSAQSAAIGGDGALSKAIRVMTCRQNDGGAPLDVIRDSGDNFSSADVGRLIFWSDGTKSTITAFISTSRVTVKESVVRSATACCIEPKTRKYCDIIRDEVSSDRPNLRTRITSYSLQNRFFLPMPNCDMGEVTANMVWGIIVGEMIVYYCSADVGYRHQAGYFYESKQREIFQDAIYEISEVSNGLSVKCGHSTRAIPINQFGSYVIDAAGTAIITATGQSMVDERIGVKNFGGVLPIDRSKQLIVTSEPAIRLFDGASYGENLAIDRIQKVLESCQAAYAMSYDTVNGATIWMLQE